MAATELTRWHRELDRSRFDLCGRRAAAKALMAAACVGGLTMLAIGGVRALDLVALALAILATTTIAKLAGGLASYRRYVRVRTALSSRIQELHARS